MPTFIFGPGRPALLVIVPLLLGGCSAAIFGAFEAGTVATAYLIEDKSDDYYARGSEAGDGEPKDEAARTDSEEAAPDESPERPSKLVFTIEDVVPETSVAPPDLLASGRVVSIVFEKPTRIEKPYGVVVSIVNESDRDGFTVSGVGEAQVRLDYEVSKNRYRISGDDSRIFDKRPSVLRPIEVSGWLRVRRF